MIELVDRAIAFALRAHDGQQRKTGSGMPFVAHPLAVGMMLQAMGCPETVVAAGLLHDTVEDTDVTLDELRHAFGDEVARLVGYCTEPRGRWETRKQYLIESLREAPLEAKLVAAADKVHNLHHLEHSLDAIGPEVWERFSRGPAEQAWYYRTVARSILNGVAEPERYPVFAELESLVATLFEGISPQP